MRVGIINIMPHMETYEPMLLARLRASRRPIELVFVRLETHAYASSDRAHLARFYEPYSSAGALDGLILTGAPVEELEFEEVRYWPELARILEHAHEHVTSTLGICWGGMAIGKMLGVPKARFAQKLFGAYAEHTPAGETVIWAQSRHAGCDEGALAEKERRGELARRSSSVRTGTSVFASPGDRFVAHLGHPEYEVERLLYEWRRDRDAGRADVPAPHGIDLDRPMTTWREDSERFLARWLARVAEPARSVCA